MGLYQLTRNLKFGTVRHPVLYSSTDHDVTWLHFAWPLEYQGDFQPGKSVCICIQKFGCYIWLDNDSKTISNIVRVSSFHIRNISRIRKYLNQSAAEQIIHAFVTSRLDNGNALFYGLPQNQISRLQHIQNTAARVVTLSRKSCHITPILKELHWLPVSQRIVFKLMLIVHKSVNNIAPIYISELLKVYTPSRNLRSSNMSLLKEPTSKRTWGDRSFSVAAPRLWNHLPTKVKSCHSITRFKSLLKTHLMSQFFKDDVYL